MSWFRSKITGEGEKEEYDSKKSYLDKIEKVKTEILSTRKPFSEKKDDKLTVFLELDCVIY